LGERFYSRASIRSPRNGTFFEQRCYARIRDHLMMMMGNVNLFNVAQRARCRAIHEKKAGSKERLKVLAT